MCAIAQEADAELGFLTNILLSCLKEVFLKWNDPKTVVAVLGSFFADLPFVRAIVISTVVKSNCLSVLIDVFCINGVGVCEDVSAYHYMV